MKKLTDEEKAKLVDNILNDFDFKKVLKVMRFLDWKWRGKTPTLSQLRREAERCLYTTLNTENCMWCGTGGFMAYIDEECLGLNFRVEECLYPINEDEEFNAKEG